MEPLLLPLLRAGLGGALPAHQKFEGVVLCQLLAPDLHLMAQAPQFGSWGTAGTPSCGDHVLMDSVRG